MRQHSFISKKTKYAGVALSAAIAGMPAISSADEDSSAYSGLEEIVVTAQKRSTDLQDTPLTVYAFNKDALRDAGAYDLKSLANSVPSLHVGGQGNDLSIALRGVTSFEGGERGDASIAFHVNGIYMARPYGAGAPFYDVERVEVLSGPQGTLYGRNATGGIVNVITKKPVDHFEASLDLNFGDYNQFGSEGMINIPVSDNLMVRGAFYTNKHDGYIDNGPVEDGNDKDDKSARITVLYEPTDKFTLLLNADYTEKGGVGGVTRARGTGESREKFDLDRESSRDDEVYGIRWEANYEFDFATLTYIGSSRRADIDWRDWDLDGSNDQVGYGDELWHFETKSKEDSHELRLASNNDENMEWMFGLYYFEEEQDVAGTYLYQYDAFGYTYSWFGIWDYGLSSDGEVESDTKAAFVQLGYDISDNVKLSLGLRYTEDEKERLGAFIWEEIELGTILDAGVEPYSAADTWTSTDWKVGLDWNVTEDNLVYFTVGTGYKAGGYNDGFDAPTFDAEEILAYELGTKNRFLDNRLQLNASVFYYDYTDLQVSQTEGANAGNTITRNAGEASIYGAEISSVALIGASTKFDLNLGYLDTEYGKTVMPEPFLGGVMDIDGNQLVKAPELSVSAGLEHSISFTTGGTLTARIQTAYRSKTHLRVFNFSDDVQDAHSVTDLLLTYTSPADDWYIQGYVKNLEDESVITALSVSGGLMLEAYGPPRTYGVRVGYSWD